MLLFVVCGSVYLDLRLRKDHLLHFFLIFFFMDISSINGEDLIFSLRIIHAKMLIHVLRSSIILKGCRHLSDFRIFWVKNLI